MNRLKRFCMRWKWLLILVLLSVSCRVVNPIAIHFENDKESVSIGESWEGSLQNGKRLPSSGKNFKGVSHLLMAIGRNGVHGELRELVLEVYDSLYAINPEWKYLYGETGWVGGGKFWPHYTHQNGMVVDFMVPVYRIRDSAVRTIPSHPFNRWGYAYDFDTLARSKKLHIDFESMATHLYLLQELGKKRKMSIKRIIFAPEYLPYLYATKYGKQLQSIEFVYKPNWVRHDEHYHTEFLLDPS